MSLEDSAWKALLAVHYDTLIIGAGLSGLAAGIRLAYFNQKVCVVEKHYTIGGLNSFYRLRGFDHDVGLHAMTNYAEPGTKKGPLSKLLRQLRLSWDDFALCPQVGSKIAFPDCSLKFTNDFEVLRAEIAQTFPYQIDGFNKFVEHLLQADELNLQQQIVPARTVVEQFLNDRLLIDMLYCPVMFYGSAREHDMDWNQFVIMFKALYLEGFGRPHKGVRVILKHLNKQYRSLGGELKLRSGVKRILTENNKAVGLELESGEQLTADRILSSAGAPETERLLCDEDSTTQPTHQTPAGQMSFNEMIYVLDEQPAAMGHEETIVFYNNAPEFHYTRPEEPCDLRSGIICSPNNFVYDEPLEKGVLRMTAIAEPSFWIHSEEEQYRAAKQEWEAKILESAQPHLPDFESHIIDRDMFTPRTVKRFTSHLNGCVYGSPEKNLQGTTDYDGLYICGTDQGFLGIIGAMLSGITMANNHCLPR